VRYSTGAAVRAGDIRRGIERTVAQRTFAGTAFYAPAIVGGGACLDATGRAAGAKEPLPDCDLSTGIVADDRTGTVTIHLTRPTPEFLYQLALPQAAAVPQDTPLHLAPGTFLPATGPYMISSYTRQQRATDARPFRHGHLQLVRNPHFRSWSRAAQPEGYPDRLVLETGYTEDEAIGRVSDGRADFLWQARPLADVDRLRNRPGAQLHSSAGLWTFYVFLNTTKPPFDNPVARRAVAFGLDRAALASVRGFLHGQVTCQLIPPGFAGYQRYCPLTLGGGADGRWAGPDVATALDLVRESGTRGARVVYLAGREQPFRDVGRLVVRQLNRLGYRATMVTDFDLADDPHNDWHAGAIGWLADYPAASNPVQGIGSCAGLGTSGTCDREIDKQITSAIAQQVADPGSASDAWAAIDHDVVDAAAVIPFSNNEQHELVSRRVGNTLVHPSTGMLIAQLWVQ
jgi:peptide/nickel transport system substrate-binding protein